MTRHTKQIEIDKAGGNDTEEAPVGAPPSSKGRKAADQHVRPKKKVAWRSDAAASARIRAVRGDWLRESSPNSPEFREPFAGAGAVGLHAVAEQIHDRIWLNDRDSGLCSLWLACQQHAGRLKDAVRAFAPSVEAFTRWKEYFLSNPAMPDDDAELITVACGRLALQPMSYGSLGPMAGAPRGGWHQQRGEILSRWNPASMCQKIDAIASLLEHARITNLDFSAVIGDEAERAAIYCDPPYVSAGPRLYLHSFAEADHTRLCDLLRHTIHRWLLSYDDHPMVWDLYAKFANIEKVEMRYSATRSVKVHELLIRPRSRRVLATRQKAGR